jgi:hypothetical protein
MFTAIKSGRSGCAALTYEIHKIQNDARNVSGSAVNEVEDHSLSRTVALNDETDSASCSLNIEGSSLIGAHFHRAGHALRCNGVPAAITIAAGRHVPYPPKAEFHHFVPLTARHGDAKRLISPQGKEA